MATEGGGREIQGRGVMSEIIVAAVQASFTDDRDRDIARVEVLVREAAGAGAQVILPPELFEGLYFCRHEHERTFARALPVGEHPAIGSEPEEPELDTRRPWQRAMLGHAVSNIMPVVASNRTGLEEGQSFYGHSFICDHFGEILQEMPEGVLVQRLDLARAAEKRVAFGFFRDRRPELYGRLARDE
jgi:predicted amidohydrolase